MNFTREDLENAFEAGREYDGDSFDTWFYDNFVSELPSVSNTDWKTIGDIDVNSPVDGARLVILADLFKTTQAHINEFLVRVGQRKADDTSFRYEEKPGVFDGGSIKVPDVDDPK